MDSYTPPGNGFFYSGDELKNRTNTINNSQGQPQNFNFSSGSFLTNNPVSSGVKYGIDKVGSGLGFSAGTAAPTAGSSLGSKAASNVASSSAGIGSLSGVMGAAGLGAAGGGILGGMVNDNPTGGSVGGSIGAAAGMAIGGPVGALIGGALGGVAGSFFGKKKPGTSVSEFLAYVGPDGNFQDIGFGNKRASNDFSKGFSEEIKQITTNLAKQGVNLDDVTVRGGFNTLRSGGDQPGFIALNEDMNNKIYFDPNDNRSKRTALTQMIQRIASQKGIEIDPNEILPAEQVEGVTSFTAKAPMVAARRENGSQSFAQFLQEYRAK